MIPLGVMAGGHVETASWTGADAFLGTQDSAADLTTYTFTGIPLGTPSPNRSIIVVASSRKGAPGATLSSVTIGGVTATIDAQSNYSGTTCGVAHATVPTGASGDVVVTWSTGVLRSHVAAVVVDGPLTLSDSATVVGQQYFSATVDAQADGLVLVGYASHNLFIQAQNWPAYWAEEGLEAMRYHGGVIRPTATAPVTVDGNSATGAGSQNLVVASYQIGA